mmetsp:Transcript_13877/g.60618  ORF Transcript_13877/g.60618 Transcript_13877/m.60618 type:complete len:203 (-) Transcript_13877:553-1161(-)
MPCTARCSARNASITSRISLTSSSSNLAPSIAAAARAGDMSRGSFVPSPVQPAVAATTGIPIRTATANSAVESTPPLNSTPSGRSRVHRWCVATWCTAATRPRARRSDAASIPSSHSGSSPTVRTPSASAGSIRPVGAPVGASGSNAEPRNASNASVALVQGSTFGGMSGRRRVARERASPRTVHVGSRSPANGSTARTCRG